MDTLPIFQAMKRTSVLRGLLNRCMVAAGMSFALAAFAWSTAAATKPAIPPGLYPAGASIGFRPHVSNHQLDCLWSFYCEGHLALFHTETQDQLERTGGWAEFAGARLDGGRMGFELFSSIYAANWSKRAYENLIVAIENHGYSPLGGHSLRLSNGNGGSMAELQPNGRSDIVVMACWTGTREVEGLVYFAHSARAQHDALRFVRRQIGQALRQGIQGPLADDR